MDGSRFDQLTRALSRESNRRGVLGGLLGIGAGLVGIGAVGAACPSGQISRRGTCLCRATGRPPARGACPCPTGQTDTGDGLGCLGCRSAAECPPSDACTAYACVAGQCARIDIACPDDDPCGVAACDPALGCVATPVPDEEPGGCVDGAVCCAGRGCTYLGTANDCAACGHLCSGATPFCVASIGCVSCRTARDCGTSDACTTYSCVLGVCHASVHPGAACDDGDRCTEDDVCRADGSCRGTPVVCTALDSCHDLGVCDSETGLCTNPTKPDGVSCSDGNACTQTDTCRGGVCTGANPVECAPPDECHEAGFCNQTSGECEYQAKADGTVCTGGDKCLSVYTCQAGVCTGSEPVVCPQPDQCHDLGVCNPATGLCSNPAKADDTPCETGNLCTDDTCQAGVCTERTTGAACPPLTDEECQVQGTCDPATGSCEHGNREDGLECTGGTCCGGACCPEGQSCCDGVCCGDGLTCCNGTCCVGCCNGTCCSERCCGSICCNFPNSCCKSGSLGRTCYVGSQFCS